MAPTMNEASRSRIGWLILRIHLAGLLGMACASQTVATVFHAPVYALFDLDPAEAKLFENLACMDRYGVKIDTAQGSISETDTLADALAVYARCKSHRRIDGHPVVYKVECRRENPAIEWRCDEGVETLLARIDRILVRIDIDGSDATMDQAYAAIKNLRAAGPYKRIFVEDPVPPATEGIASCRAFTAPDGVTKVDCFGGDTYPLSEALELKP
jgi:hypothetical protein